MTASTAIRLETAADIEAIHSVVAAAFPSDTEAKLVDLIRERNQALLSLVATIDDVIVGHVLLSPIDVSSRPVGYFAGVAPLSVQPEYQGRGIGGQLMYEVIEAARTLNIEALFLLGSPKYYPRFGFVKSHIGNEYGAIDAFMHFEIVPSVLKDLMGAAVYVPAFKEVGA